MSRTQWNFDWHEQWDPQVGLWWQARPGHTVEVRKMSRLHVGRAASERLIQAALVGRLDQLPAEEVLAALRKMQNRGPEQYRGCFCWYWEESQPADTNAAFFIGMHLLILHLRFRDQLSPRSQVLLDQMLADLHLWFSGQVRERTFYYPNKFLGDLVCEWLLLESLGLQDKDGTVERIMLQAADYWQQQGWGWGEHLSDGYSSVCLQEISMLLLLSRHLSQRVRERYQELLGELLSLEDRFDGGIRVPALRSYAFSASPQHMNYRDKVKPLDHLGPGQEPQVENLLFAEGWHKLAPPRQQPAEQLSIRCFGTAVAQAYNQPDIRLGSVSRFPLMSSNEHLTWGLAWQSFPVCLWRPQGDWGFLQWEVRRGERVRCHPASGGLQTNYGSVALALGLRPPLVGRTWALQRGGSVLALRVMPGVMTNWDHLIDRFRIISPKAQVQTTKLSENCDQLVLDYGDRQVSVVCLRLDVPDPMELMQGEQVLDWQRKCPAQEMDSRHGMATLWGISLQCPVAGAPQLEHDPEALVVPRSAEQQAWRLHWTWPEQNWEVRIDPLADEPLRGL